MFYTDKLVKADSRYDDWMATQSDRFKAAGVNGTIKLNAFAAFEGEVLLRFENLADSTIDQAESHFINVTAVVEAIWKSQNREEPLPEGVVITRMNLAGTTEWADMGNLQWKTVDDKESARPARKAEDPGLVEMKPMQTKNFWVDGFY